MTKGTEDSPRTGRKSGRGLTMDDFVDLLKEGRSTESTDWVATPPVSAHVFEKKTIDHRLTRYSKVEVGKPYRPIRAALRTLCRWLQDN